MITIMIIMISVMLIRYSTSFTTQYFHKGSRHVSTYQLHAVKNLTPVKGNPNCKLCLGKEGMNCTSCAGTGIDKKNGNVFERWTCNKCKGFGFIPCTNCNKNSRGLTPEQTGER